MRTVYYTHGICLVGLAIFTLIPAMLDLYMGYKPGFEAFMITSFICFFIGGILMLTNQSKNSDLDVRHAYILTTTLWISIPLAAAIPFYLLNGQYHLDFTDSVFESVSGITTTGSTVYVGLDNAPAGILLWRSITTYLGGVGIVVLTMGVLPYLRVGGMQLFQTESSDRTEKILPKTYQIALLTMAIYTILFICCTTAYYLGGMSLFDSVIHAMPTIATAGFSSHDMSFAYFNSPTLEWISTVFMIAGATPLLLYYAILAGHSANRALLEQAKFFWIQLSLMILAVTAYIFYEHGKSFEESFRQSAFNITSVITTTGFISTDYSLWGGFAVMMFYFATVMGGCTGSTSGGIKTFRIQVMVKMIRLQIKRLIMPHGVFTEHIGGKTLTEAISKSVVLFFLVYVGTFAFVAMGMSATGLDMITSLSGAASAMANVGPGLGTTIGPVGNFSSLTDTAKWFYIFGMIAGRLEVVTIFVLLTKNFWEDVGRC